MYLTWMTGRVTNLHIQLMTSSSGSSGLSARLSGALLGAAAEALSDMAAVEAILSSARKPSAAEHDGLIATLEWLCPDLRSPFIRREPQVRYLMETTRRNPQAVLCHDSDRVKQLPLLDSGLRQIELAINARLKALIHFCHSRGRRRVVIGVQKGFSRTLDEA